MRSQLRWAILALSACLAAGTVRADDDACKGMYMGAHLLENLADLSLTTDTLKLLNGREDPKLKRHLEWRLVRAAAEARRHIEEGAIVEGSPGLPILAAGVERAATYVREHDLDGKPPVPSDKDVGKPLENLGVVRKWVSARL